MADVTTTGLAQLLSGAIAGDGGMGTSLTSLGLVNQDSVALDTADPETTEFFAEQVDDPIYSTSKKGITTVTLDLGFADLQQIQKVMGGTIVGTGDDAVWNAPDQIPSIELSFKLVPTNGWVLNIPRGKVSAKLTGGFIKTDNMKVNVVITILKPTKSGVPSYFLSSLAAEEE